MPEWLCTSCSNMMFPRDTRRHNGASGSTLSRRGCGASRTLCLLKVTYKQGHCQGSRLRTHEASLSLSNSAIPDHYQGLSARPGTLIRKHKGQKAWPGSRAEQPLSCARHTESPVAIHGFTCTLTSSQPPFLGAHDWPKGCGPTQENAFPHKKFITRGPGEVGRSLCVHQVHFISFSYWTKLKTPGQRSGPVLLAASSPTSLLLSEIMPFSVPAALGAWSPPRPVCPHAPIPHSM